MLIEDQPGRRRCPHGGSGALVKVSAHAVLLCLFLLSSCTHTSYRKSAPSISLFPYDPEHVVAFTAFPPLIQSNVSTYLSDRLGSDLYGKTRFTWGEIVDFDELRRVDPKANYQWKVFTFRLVYTLS